MDSEGGFQINDAAREALAEYGGLKVDVHGAGIDVAKGGFQIDPLLAQGEEERFSTLGRSCGVRLYPLGEAYGGHAFLGIDERGEVYLLMDDVTWVARDMTEALEAIVLGKRPRRKSAPDATP